MSRMGDVLVVADGPVVWATIDRPAARNSLSLSVVEGLEAALANALDRQAKVVVLRGAGGNFCAGADLTVVRPIAGDPVALGRYVDRLVAITERLESGPFVSVAVVEGSALAGGCELLLACDLSLAAADARIGDRHLEYGLAPGAGGSVRLVRALTKARARYLLLTGEAITGTEAAEWGLVTRAVPPEAVEEAAQALVARLSCRSGDALRAVKQMAVQTAEGTLAEGLRAERRLFLAHMAASTDVKEGLAAFAERRPPEFQS